MERLTGRCWPRVSTRRGGRRPTAYSWLRAAGSTGERFRVARVKILKDFCQKSQLLRTYRKKLRLGPLKVGQENSQDGSENRKDCNFLQGLANSCTVQVCCDHFFFLGPVAKFMVENCKLLKEKIEKSRDPCEFYF